MKTSLSPDINHNKLKRNLNALLQPSSSISLKKPNNLFILPPIDYETKKQHLIRPTSILTKFIHNRTKKLLKSTKLQLKKPLKLNIDKINLKQSHNNLIRNKGNNFFITDNGMIMQDSKHPSNKNNIFSFSGEEDNNGYKRNINNIDNLSSLSIDHKFRENQINILIPKYRRIRIYQPIISENWKFKNGLRVTVGNEKVNLLPLKNDIEYQYKIINDEFKLLEDNYNYYKTRIIIKDYYYESFRAISLTLKIKYNKSLEESIGILYLLPQLLLVEFYKLIKNYSSVAIPNPELFKEKYVFDEVKNLRYNNNLLIKVFDFCKSCYEVYGTLIKEVNDMCLKENDFINVINCIEKARYNLSYVSNASENSFKDYNSDLKYIQKIINDKSVSKSIDLTQKMRNQFGFKKNEEKQRKLRIETALDNKNDKDDSNEEKNKKKVFNSFVEYKLINGLMKHLTKDARNQITTLKINKEIDGNYDDDEEEVNKKHKVVRINI